MKIKINPFKTVVAFFACLGFHWSLGLEFWHFVVFIASLALISTNIQLKEDYES